MNSPKREVGHNSLSLIISITTMSPIQVVACRGNMNAFHILSLGCLFYQIRGKVNIRLKPKARKMAASYVIESLGVSARMA